jgi:hypothetical protein
MLAYELLRLNTKCVRGIPSGGNETPSEIEKRQFIADFRGGVEPTIDTYQRSRGQNSTQLRDTYLPEAYLASLYDLATAEGMVIADTAEPDAATTAADPVQAEVGGGGEVGSEHGLSKRVGAFSSSRLERRTAIASEFELQLRRMLGAREQLDCGRFALQSYAFTAARYRLDPPPMTPSWLRSNTSVNRPVCCAQVTFVAVYPAIISLLRARLATPAVWSPTQVTEFMLNEHTIANVPKRLRPLGAALLAARYELRLRALEALAVGLRVAVLIRQLEDRFTEYKDPSTGHLAHGSAARGCGKFSGSGDRKQNNTDAAPSVDTGQVMLMGALRVLAETLALEQESLAKKRAAKAAEKVARKVELSKAAGGQASVTMPPSTNGGGETGVEQSKSSVGTPVSGQASTESNFQRSHGDWFMQLNRHNCWLAPFLWEQRSARRLVGRQLVDAVGRATQALGDAIDRTRQLSCDDEDFE